MASGSWNTRVWTWSTTASSAAARCTITRSGTRRASRPAAPSAPSTTSTTPRLPSSRSLSWRGPTISKSSSSSGRTRIAPSRPRSLTGAYTIMDWSYDEHYAKDIMLGAAAHRAEARRRFGVEVARDMVRPNVTGLVEAGAEWVQIDEPAATTRPEEVPPAVETFNATREGVDARASMHICFSDYNSLFPHIEALDDCYELQLEFSNRDSRELGTKAEDRPGYDVLERFAGSAWDGKIGLGVIDIHTNFIEPP